MHASRVLPPKPQPQFVLLAKCRTHAAFFLFKMSFHESNQPFMRLSSLLLMFAFLFLLAGSMSCTKKSNNCSSLEKAPVLRVEGAGTVALNRELPLTVTFLGTSGCAGFGNFEETTSGNSIQIVVNARYEGCVCTAIVSEISVVYRFRKAEPGTYTLLFQKPDGGFYTHTVVVQ
jgi:hypothetical protein